MGGDDRGVADMRCFRGGSDSIPCIKCQSARGETRLATISSTRRVLVTQKNQDKIRIKDFGDQRDKGECRHT